MLFLIVAVLMLIALSLCLVYIKIFHPVIAENKRQKFVQQNRWDFDWYLRDEDHIANYFYDLNRRRAIATKNIGQEVALINNHANINFTASVTKFIIHAPNKLPRFKWRQYVVFCDYGFKLREFHRSQALARFNANKSTRLLNSWEELVAYVNSAEYLLAGKFSDSSPRVDISV